MASSRTVGFHALLATILWFLWAHRSPVNATTTTTNNSSTVSDSSSLPTTVMTSIHPRFRNSARFNLTTYLFGTGYNPLVEPVLNSSRPAVVSMALTVVSLEAVDIKRQLMRQTGHLAFSWKDEFLQWDPADYEGLDIVLVPQGRIWTPDVALYTCVGDSVVHLGHSELLVQVSYDGTVLWVPFFSVETACNVNIAHYPYDTQECSWSVYPWASNARMMKFDSPAGVFGHRDIHNAEWEIVEVINMTCDFIYDDQLFSCIEYKYTMKRRSKFLTLGLVMPIILLAFLTPLVFCLPAESGERVSLVVTLMLAFTLFLSIFMDVLPRSSLQTSFLMVYLVFLSSCAAVGASLTVLVLSLHHKPDHLPLTETARVFVSVLASAGYLKINKPPRKKSPKASGPDYGDDYKLSLEALDLKSAWNYPLKDGVCDKEGDKAQVEGLTEERSPEVTWRHVAAGCDAIFFRLFLSLVVLATGVCFMFMTGVL